MSSVITGEAVALQLRSATFFSRAVGALLDLLATGVVFVLGWIVIGLAFINAPLDPAALGIVAVAWLVACTVILPLSVETFTRGKSLGKLAMGLRVVRDDGGAIRFRHALIRALTGLLEIYLCLGALAALTSIFNPASKRIGDLMAGTYAITERITVPPWGLTLMPAHLAGWAAAADMRGIPDGLSRRIHRFMGQALAMAPASRFALAAALADEASHYVAPQPPVGTDPGDFLAALTTERRNRDFARLSGQAQRGAALAQRTSRLPF